MEKEQNNRLLSVKRVLGSNLFYVILLIIIGILIIKRCEEEPITITKTKVIYETIKDTVHTTIIQEPEIVYVEKVVTRQGKDSIIYVDKPSSATVVAKEYSTLIKSNGASADLQITTTGKLLKVEGIIEYPEKETIIENTIIKPKSGLFLYGEASTTPFERVGVGLDYQIKNTIIIGSSVDYNNLTKSTNLNVKLGFRIF